MRILLKICYSSFLTQHHDGRSSTPWNKKTSFSCSQLLCCPNTLQLCQQRCSHPQAPIFGGLSEPRFSLLVLPRHSPSLPKLTLNFLYFKLSFIASIEQMLHRWEQGSHYFVVYLPVTAEAKWSHASEETASKKNLFFMLGTLKKHLMCRVHVNATCFFSRLTHHSEHGFNITLSLSWKTSSLRPADTPCKVCDTT